VISFHLNEKPYIELNKLLKILRWATTGGAANLCIEQGKIKVNGHTETRKRKKMKPGDLLEFEGQKAQILPAPTAPTD
jgi:ribosome-associated protein